MDYNLIRQELFEEITAVIVKIEKKYGLDLKTHVRSGNIRTHIIDLVLEILVCSSIPKQEG